MSKINDLRVQRAKTWEQAKAFLDSHRTDKGILSAEDTATYEKMEQEIVDLGHEIERQERLDALEREMNAPTAKPLTGKPEATKVDEKTGRASDAYKAAFWNQVRAKDGISSEVRNALSEGVDSEGGYLVPDEFEHTLVQALSANNIVRDHAHVFTTNSGVHKIPVVTSKGTAAWVDEGAALPESDDVFGQQLIGAHKVATLIKVSEELLNDSAFDLEDYFTTEFARRIGNTEEDAFLNGNGTGKPTGIFDNTAGAQTGVTAGSATAVTADEIIDLFYSLESVYRRNAIWLLNDTTIKTIRKLKDSNGQYLWQPALHEGTFDTLLGKRIFTSPFVPEMAAGKKSIAFGDFSFYWIGDRQGITFRRLNERFAETGQIGFLASKRLDGKLVLPEAIKVLQQKGGASSAS
ncbi:MAG: phage major capsid protein [Ruminococcus flavefaciens]|nr:phage major capsid protein [Ruminococcus flavefaciens]